MLVGIRNELLQKDEIINGVTFIGDIRAGRKPGCIKKVCYDLKNNLNDYVAVLCANIGGKASVAIGISDTVVAARNLDAGKILKEHVSGLIKGGGGGQKNLATAGGQDAIQFTAGDRKSKIAALMRRSSEFSDMVVNCPGGTWLCLFVNIRIHKSSLMDSIINPASLTAVGWRFSIRQF